MSTTSRPGPRARWVGLAAMVALGLSGCASASADERADGSSGTVGPSTTTAPVQGRLGTLEVSGGYVPQPASPDVAAAYLTITDTGATGDAVVGASSDAGGTITLHATQGGAMIPLSRLAVPPHGSAAFAPGGAHLMITSPTRALTRGGTVAVMLVFAHAGRLTVQLPVTGYGTGGMSMSPGDGMS